MSQVWVFTRRTMNKYTETKLLLSSFLLLFEKLTSYLGLPPAAILSRLFLLLNFMFQDSFLRF